VFLGQVYSEEEAIKRQEKWTKRGICGRGKFKLGTQPGGSARGFRGTKNEKGGVKN
jgi:hypothetical protein